MYNDQYGGVCIQPVSVSSRIVSWDAPSLREHKIPTRFTFNKSKRHLEFDRMLKNYVLPNVSMFPGLDFDVDTKELTAYLNLYNYEASEDALDGLLRLNKEDRNKVLDFADTLGYGIVTPETLSALAEYYWEGYADETEYIDNVLDGVASDYEGVTRQDIDGFTALLDTIIAEPVSLSLEIKERMKTCGDPYFPVPFFVFGAHGSVQAGMVEACYPQQDFNPVFENTYDTLDALFNDVVFITESLKVLEDLINELERIARNTKSV